MKQDKYKILKVLNNNVILSKNINKGQEIILIGKGIGFGKKSNQIVEINPNKIEKSFHNFDKQLKQDYIKLINALDNEVMGISEEIIANAEKVLGKLNPHIHIALTDHIGFAFERLKNKMEINNPFLYEIKELYHQEYEVGRQAEKLIEQRFKIQIPDSEVGFIALHLHSARQNKNVKDTVYDTRILKEALDIIQKELNFNIDSNRIMYSRLIRHLQQSISRSEQNKSIQNPLLNEIKLKFKNSYNISKKVAQYICENKNITLSDDEIGFLTLHIARLNENI